MKTLIFSVFLFISVLSLHAQDVVILNDGTELKVKVTRISESSVSYKQLDNPGGPDYTIDKSRVILIQYKNGRTESFVTKSNPIQEDNSPAVSTDIYSPSIDIDDYPGDELVLAGRNMITGVVIVLVGTLVGSVLILAAVTVEMILAGSVITILANVFGLVASIGGMSNLIKAGKFLNKIHLQMQ